MDGQNLQAPPPAPSNRPLPPPPRSPHGMGATPQQPATGHAAQQPSTAPAPVATPALPPAATPGGYTAQQTQYPPQTAQQPYGGPQPPTIVAQQGQTGYPYGQGEQYYAKSGLPLWVWLTGGGALLAIIAGTMILILLLGGNKANGGVTGGGGGTGGGNSPSEVAVAFWSSMIQHNYDAARVSLAPGSALSSAQLRQLMEQNEQSNQTTYTSVTAGRENLAGDTATVSLEMQTASGRTADLTPSVTKVGSKWFVAEPGFPNLPAQP